MCEVCEKKGVDRENVKFMYNGKEIFETDTFNSVGMKNGDIIETIVR